MLATALRDVCRLSEASIIGVFCPALSENAGEVATGELFCGLQFTPAAHVVLPAAQLYYTYHGRIHICRCYQYLA